MDKNEGEKLANDNNIDFFEISNKDGVNINEAALNIINKILVYKQNFNADYISSNSSKLAPDKLSNQHTSTNCC